MNKQLRCKCGERVFMTALFSDPPRYEIKCYKCGLETKTYANAFDAEKEWKELTKKEDK